MVKIHTLTLPHGLILAPMAGYTDYGMRRVCRALGAELTVTEMISAKATVFEDKKTEALARIREDEAPCAVQIFGSEEDTLARAAERLSHGTAGGLAPVAIDINMGCPVQKIYGNGDGSALMKDPERIERIVRAVRTATDLPVTVKLRAGIDATHINAVECALAAEAGGAHAVTVHGRTKGQMYSGTADRNIIKKVKCALHIPVIANGDVTSAERALSMLRDTGADGLMVARGAVGNPFIFSEILCALRGECYTPPTVEERAAWAMRQLSYTVLDKGEELAVRECRKQLASYLSGFRGAAALRARIHTATTVSDVARAFEEACAACEQAENETAT